MDVKSYIALAYWMKVIGAFLIVLTFIVLLIFGIDFLVKNFFPVAYKRFSDRCNRGIELAKDRILAVVLPTYIIGLLAIIVMQVSTISRRLFWVACVLAIVFLEGFYLIEKYRSDGDRK